MGVKTELSEQSKLKGASGLCGAESACFVGLPPSQVPFQAERAAGLGIVWTQASDFESLEEMDWGVGRERVILISSN